MLKFKIFIPVLLSSFALFSQANIEVHVLKLSGELSNGDLPIQQLDINKELNVEKPSKIRLYPNIEFQTIEGVGGAFNEIGGEALMSLPKTLQTEVMFNLFGKDKAGFSYCRTAVGASDFGIDAYSYSEVPEDYTMKHFSIKREKKTVITYIQKAIEINPDLKIFASPWSPPAWMKYSGAMDGGNEFPEKNQLRDDPKIYQAYALYFSKYIEAYAKKGITVDRLVIQNETDANTKYPSNDMSVTQMSSFVKNYLRPQFTQDEIDTEIWAGTFRTHGRLDAVELAANKEYRKLFDGIGIQYTSGVYIQQTQDLFPEVKLMHTEGVCYDGKNTWDQASRRLKEIAGYINRGVPNYCYWNIILNETTESGWGWKQNSLINIDREEKEVTYNPDYAVIAFVSKYLVKGAKRIANFSRDDLISLKYNNQIIVLVQNDGKTPKAYEYQIEDEEGQQFEIPAKSLAAIVIKK